MRAYIQALHGRPWNEECRVAFDGFKKLGIECVLFGNDGELDGLTKQDVVVGGMLIIEHVLKTVGITIPIYNYPICLKTYLGRRIWETKLKYLQREKLPIFIKPLEEKIAQGIVVNTWNEIGEYNRLDQNSIILCSEVINFVSEWRCFVRYGKIVDIKWYKGNKNVECDYNLISMAVKSCVNMPAAYTLDFGVTANGKTLLIEMNDGMAIGCYGLDSVLYAKFLTTRWTELVNGTDPFA